MVKRKVEFIPNFPVLKRTYTRSNAYLASAVFFFLVLVAVIYTLMWTSTGVIQEVGLVAIAASFGIVIAAFGIVLNVRLYREFRGVPDKPFAFQYIEFSNQAEKFLHDNGWEVITAKDVMDSALLTGLGEGYDTPINRINDPDIRAKARIIDGQLRITHL